MQQKGYAFYFEIVPSDEINRNMEINEAGFRFYYGQPVEKDLPCPSSITFISTYREKKDSPALRQGIIKHGGWRNSLYCPQYRQVSQGETIRETTRRKYH